MWITIDSNGIQKQARGDTSTELRNLASPLSERQTLAPVWHFYEDDLPVSVLDDNLVPTVKRNASDVLGVKDYAMSWYYRTLSAMPILETHVAGVERKHRADLIAHDYMDSTFFAHTLMAYNNVKNLKEITPTTIINVPDLSPLAPSELIAMKESTYPTVNEEAELEIIDNPCGKNIDILGVI